LIAGRAYRAKAELREKGVFTTVCRPRPTWREIHAYAWTLWVKQRSMKSYVTAVATIQGSMRGDI